MTRRNWTDLAKKLISTDDLDFSFNAVQEIIGENSLAWFGEGIVKTTQYPNPFPISMDPVHFTGIVGNGTGFDVNGQIVKITSLSTTSKAFAVDGPDSSHDRWDLLVIRYNAKPSTLIPKPSDPIQTVALNLVDDFTLEIIKGTPAFLPTYPAKGPTDIILCGLRVPLGITVGSQIVVDYSVRETGNQVLVNLPVIEREVPSGSINGINQNFVISQDVMNNTSILVFVDGLPVSNTSWSIVNKTITLTTAPVVGQDVYVWYFALSPNSQNPLSGLQEVPTGVIDGSNGLFQLSGQPSDQRSLLVFVDGKLINPADFDLITGLTQSSINFHAGSKPQVGQDVFCFYLANPAAVGTSGGGGGGGGGGAVNLKVEYPTLSSGDISNGFVGLSQIPGSAANVMMDVIGGGAQVYGVDFTIAGADVVFLGALAVGGGSALIAGDKLRVMYTV